MAASTAECSDSQTAVGTESPLVVQKVDQRVWWSVDVMAVSSADLKVGAKVATLAAL
jgi:hypothetical protein